MSHILSYTGHVVAPRKQRQALAALCGVGLRETRPLMGAICPRVRNLVIFPDSAHGISQLGYREPLESSLKACLCRPCARRARACGPI